MFYKKKRFRYLVYDSGVFIATWSNEIVSEPSFRNVINGGPGELVIRMARSFDDFGEDVDVKLNNKIELYVYDRQTPNGTLLYTGFISGYRPILDGVSEYLEITVLSYVAELEYYMLRTGGGDTRVQYASEDPSEIFKDIIDKYNDDGGTITYTDSSIDTTSTTVSYNFQTSTTREALDKVIELAPEGWYWNVDADGIIYFKNKNAVADHDFMIGADIQQMATWRRIEDLVNRVYFTGVTAEDESGLYRVYENSGSITAYGLHAMSKVDHRVSNTDTADTMANRILDAKKDPEIRTILTVVDNNGENEYRGYDIESISPGETMRIRNIKEATKTISLWDQMEWDVDVWDQTLATSAADVIQIVSVDYSPDSVKIEASSRMPEIPKRIEDINRNLERTQTVNNPDAPTEG